MNLKTIILCGAVVIVASGCCNCKKDNGKCACPNESPEKCEQEVPCKHGKRPHAFNGPAEMFEISEEDKAKFEKWANFDNLPEAEQKSLLSERKAEIDKREAEMKKAKEEFEAKWANFDNLPVAEQKKLIEMKSRPMMMGGHHGMPHRLHHPEKPQCCDKENK